MARAWPISFCAIDESATSSSRKGAMPVHSESRQPRTSSSSATWRRSSRSLTGFPELLLQRVAVDAVVVALELVDELADLCDLRPGNHPERLRLAAPSVELAGVGLREGAVRGCERAGVLERLSLALLPEHLVDHPASSSSTTARACSPPCWACTRSGMPWAPVASRS